MSQGQRLFWVPTPWDAAFSARSPGGRFLTRGLKKVAGEAALSVMAYNIIRAINLLGAANLRASLA